MVVDELRPAVGQVHVVGSLGVVAVALLLVAELVVAVANLVAEAIIRGAGRMRGVTNRNRQFNSWG